MGNVASKPSTRTKHNYSSHGHLQSVVAVDTYKALQSWTFTQQQKYQQDCVCHWAKSELKLRCADKYQQQLERERERERYIYIYRYITFTPNFRLAIFSQRTHQWRNAKYSQQRQRKLCEKWGRLLINRQKMDARVSLIKRQKSGFWHNSAILNCHGTVNTCGALVRQCVFHIRATRIGGRSAFSPGSKLSCIYFPSPNKECIRAQYPCRYSVRSCCLFICYCCFRRLLVVVF